MMEKIKTKIISDIDRKIEVMTSFKNGHQVESTLLGCDDWSLDKYPNWNWADYDYRILEQNQIKQKGKI